MVSLRQSTVLGGACGVAGTLCYLLVILVPMNTATTFFVAMLWPVLSIVFLTAVYRLLDRESPGFWNTLALVNGCIAFALVAGMLSIQLAVGAGIEEYAAKPDADGQLLASIRESLRLVDLGLDVAWDMFIGMTLLFLFGSLRTSRHYGLGWALPSGAFGLALIVLNTITFPWPPDTRGLPDIGPFIGLFIVALAVRTMLAGRSLSDT